MPLLSTRKLLITPSTLVCGLSAAVTLGIGSAWFPDLAFAFATEDAPLAWWQAALLIACASVCGVRAQLAALSVSPRVPRDTVFWGGLALCLLLAALDERFMFHERIQDFLFFDLADAAPAARPWVHAFTAVYAVAGLALLLMLRKMAAAAAWRWFWPAIVCGIAAIVLDICYDDIGMQIVEELLETLSTTLFLCGLFMEVGSAVSPKP